MLVNSSRLIIELPADSGFSCTRVFCAFVGQQKKLITANKSFSRYINRQSETEVDFSGRTKTTPRSSFEVSTQHPENKSYLFFVRLFPVVPRARSLVSFDGKAMTHRPRQQ